MANKANYRNITTATTTVVKSGKGYLKSIILNKGVASGSIAIYDNTAGSGTLIGTITLPATLLLSQDQFPFECNFGTGLTVVTVEALDLTVVYQ